MVIDLDDIHVVIPICWWIVGADLDDVRNATQMAIGRVIRVNKR